MTLKHEHLNTCTGCVAPLVAKLVMDSAEHVVASIATGCLEVASTKYPNTAWPIPIIHSAFGNTAATISGIETAYNVLKRKGMKEEVKFVVFAGDGGTYDIGLQALSGALERGHDFVYVVLDNGGYQNTRGQRSSASPIGSSTSTTPAGKTTFRKDLTKIAAAHNIPYVAQASTFDLEDLKMKLKKALEIKGPALVNVLTACPRFWRVEPINLRKVVQLAADTCFWLSFEIENGKTKINYIPETKVAVDEFVKIQGRFKNISKEQIKMLQGRIDKDWEWLNKEQ